MAGKLSYNNKNNWHGESGVEIRGGEGDEMEGNGIGNRELESG